MATAVAERGPSLNNMLQSPAIKSRFDEVLGKKAPAFVSSILTAVNSNKALQDCTPMTVVSSAMIAASLDLPINASLGFAHIVPYKNKGVSEAQFQMGWKGFIQLALRSGQYRRINATTVLEGQIKRIDRFTGKIDFQDDAISEKVIGYLLYFELLNGYENFTYMTSKQVFDHGKKYSKSFARGYGPWTEDFDAMALKTVVKMGLGKWGVLSVEMQKAFEVDQAVVDDSGGVSEYPDNPAMSSVSVEKLEAPKSEEVKAAKPKNFAPQSKEEAEKKAAEIKARREAAIAKEDADAKKFDAAIDAEIVSEEAPPEKAPKTRAQLMQSIAEMKTKLKMSNEDFDKMMTKITGKTKKPELTSEDMAEIATHMEIEIFKTEA